MKQAAALIALAGLGWGCGYRVAGQADVIPDRIRTIAVPAFENVTTEYKIEQYMTSAVAREFIARTRYQVINDESQADAKLTGAVVQFFAFPQNLDPVTGRATTVTTITQVQGLRGCRNAGIAVPAQIIEKAKQYIYRCKNADGGISYSSRNRGSSRPAITAAALAALYNAGDYDSEHIEPMWQFCKKHLHDLGTGARYGHWHYTYLIYFEVQTCLCIKYCKAI